MDIGEIIAALLESQHAHWLTSWATSKELLEYQTAFAVRIPDEYQAFLRFSNGAVLYETEEFLGTRCLWQYEETLAAVMHRLRHSESNPLPLEFVPFHSSLPGRYTCFSTEATAGTEIVEWTESNGVSRCLFHSFGAWYKAEIHDQYHFRYS